MLKLPEPLPYDVVDKMLDEDFYFGKEQFFERDEMLELHYARRSELDEYSSLVSNYVRPMFEILDDIEGEKENEEGYVTWTYRGCGMSWTADELTEEELEDILRGIGY